MLHLPSTFSARMQRIFCLIQVSDLCYGLWGVLTIVGGPGDGGVDLIMGKDFSGEQGETWAKQWGMNFVTFDPRGTGWTAPKLSCQSSNTTAQSTLGRRTTPDEAKAVFDQKIQANLACNEANKHTDAKYVGTSAVVQDMIHFVELQAAAKGKKPEEAMINYYGVSYGTVIGQTLAQMYPNRLRRVLLDANVNGVTHYQGWAPNSLDDFAHSFWMMSKFCFEAGPEVCALANGMNSIKEVQYRFDRMMTQIENEPFNICGQPLERETYLGLIRLPMYTPRRSYNLIMNLTIALEARDEALIKQSPLIASSGILAACQPTETDTPIPATPASDTSALQIITSVDIAGRYPWKSFEDWKAAAERIVAPYAGLNYALSNG